MTRILTSENRSSFLKLIWLTSIGLFWGLLILWKIPLSLGTLLGVLAGGAIAAPFIGAGNQTRIFRLASVFLFTLAAFLPASGLYFRELLNFQSWLKAFAILLVFIGALGGLAAFLRWIGLAPTIASAGVVILAFVWLSWPVWMAPRLKGESASKIAQALVNPHPIFVLNSRLGRMNRLGEFEPAFAAPWAEHRIAYRLTNLGDDVSYHPPASVWLFYGVHAVGLLGLLCKGKVSQLGAYAKVGFLAIMGISLPALGMVVMILISPILAPVLKNAGLVGAIILIIAYFFLGGLALIPTWALSGIVGWVYGAPVGYVIALIAMSGASMVGYEFARRFAADEIVNKIHANPKLRAVHLALTGKSYWKTLAIVILIRIPSSSPFSFTNYLLACAKVPRRTYLPGSLIGLTPRTLGVVIAASKLQQYTLNPTHGEGPILISLSALVIALGALVWIAKSTLRNITSHESQ